MRPSSRALCRLLIGLAWLSAVAGLLVAWLPFDVVRLRLDGLSGDGSADLYTPVIHGRFRAAAATIGAIALVTGMVLRRYRSRLLAAVESCRHRLRRDGRRLVRDVGRLVHDLRKWLLAATVLAAAVRVPYLDEPMRYDESHTFIKYASMPAPLIVARYDEPNNHILHTLCVRATTQAFGDDPWAIRLPALVCGILLAPVTLLWGAASGGRVAGITAGLLIAVLSNAVEFSVNARGYMLASLLYVIACLSGPYALRRENTVGWTICVSTVVLSLWTVPTMLYGAIALFVWLRIETFAQRRRAEHRRRWLPLLSAFLSTVTLTILCYLPVLLAVGPRRLMEIGGGGATTWTRFLNDLPSVLREDYSWIMRDVPLVVQLTLWVGAVIALLATSPPRRRRFWQGVAAAVCVVLVMAVQRTHPPERTWCFAIPSVLILATAGLGILARWLRHRWGVPLAGELTALVLVSATAFSLSSHDSIRTSRQTGTFREAADLVAWLESHAGKGEPIIAVTPASAPLVYHARRKGLPEQHFMPPGSDRGQEATAIVVTSREFAQTPHSVLAELQWQSQYDPDTAVLLHESSTARIFRVSRRADFSSDVAH